MSGSLFDQYKAALRHGHLAAVGGDLEGALQAYQAASRLVPERALPFASQGTVLHRLDRWPEAAEAFERALRLAPDDEATLRARAVAREERGLRSGAAADFERLAFVLDVASRSAEAADAARRAADLEPSDTRAALAERLAATAAHVAAMQPSNPGTGWILAPAEPSEPSERGAPMASLSAADFGPESEGTLERDTEPERDLEPLERSEPRDSTDVTDATMSPFTDELRAQWADAAILLAEEEDGVSFAGPEPGSALEPGPSDMVPFEEDAGEPPPMGDQAAALAARIAELGTQPAWVDMSDRPIGAVGELDGEGGPWPAVDLPSPAPPPLEGPPPDPEALLAEATDLIAAGDLTAARDLMLTAAVVHRAAGRLDAALEVCLQLLSIAPGDPQVHLAIANLQLDHGWADAAKEKIELLLRLTALTGDTQAEADVHGLASERLRDDALSSPASR